MKYIKSKVLFENLYLDPKYDDKYDEVLQNCNYILLELTDCGMYARAVYLKNEDDLVLNVSILNKSVGDHGDIITDDSTINMIEDVMSRLLEYLDSEGWYVFNGFAAKSYTELKYNFKERR